MGSAGCRTAIWGPAKEACSHPRCKSRALCQGQSKVQRTRLVPGRATGYGGTPGMSCPRVPARCASGLALSAYHGTWSAGGGRGHGVRYGRGFESWVPIASASIGCATEGPLCAPCKAARPLCPVAQGAPGVSSIPNGGGTLHGPAGLFALAMTSVGMNRPAAYFQFLLQAWSAGSGLPGAAQGVSAPSVPSAPFCKAARLLPASRTPGPTCSLEGRQVGITMQIHRESGLGGFLDFLKVLLGLF